jgi:hypothetical protein
MRTVDREYVEPVPQFRGKRTSILRIGDRSAD